jgi:hypothetical protein
VAVSPTLTSLPSYFMTGKVGITLSKHFTQLGGGLDGPSHRPCDVLLNCPSTAVTKAIVLASVPFFGPGIRKHTETATNTDGTKLWSGDF